MPRSRGDRNAATRPLGDSQAAPITDASETQVPEPRDDDAWSELSEALIAYGKLFDEYQSSDMDDVTFFRRAFRIGLIVRDHEAWILDLPTQRWWRYDGVQLTTLGIADSSGGGAES